MIRQLEGFVGFSYAELKARPAHQRVAATDTSSRTGLYPTFPEYVWAT